MLTVSSGIFVIGFLTILPMMVVMTIENKDRGEAAFLLSSMIMYGAMALVGIRALRNRSTLKRTGLYNQYMEECPETEITMQALAAGSVPAEWDGVDTVDAF